jgi:DNA mismatch repair protein MutS
VSTPVRQQYLGLKAIYPDALLFFRLGDFYEMFDGDAQIAARELQLTLTAREFAKGERTPMAGVPYLHAEGYIARLIARGYRVAVADQIGDPKLAKGLVERRIVRLVTPGTIQDPQLLEAGRNNYLAAVLIQGDAAGLAYTDITTGEFTVEQVVGEPIEQTLYQELLRVAPAECLWPLDGEQEVLNPVQEIPDLPPVTPARQVPLLPPGCVGTAFSREHFSLEAARTRLDTLLGRQALDGQPYARFTLAVAAAGALIAYLEHTQQAAVPRLRAPVLYRSQDHMVLDAATRRNLEILQTMRGGEPAGSLLAVLDRTHTPMGSRLLRRWLNAPLVVLAPLLRRQQAVRAIAENTSLRLRLIEALSGIGDIDRLVSRAQQGNATPRELLALARALERVRMVRTALGMGQHEEDAPFEPSGATLSALHAALHPCDEVTALARAAFVDDPPAGVSEGGFVRAGFDPAIDALDEDSRDTREWLAALEARERTRTGIRTLKVVYTRVFGYALEIGKSALSQVPPEYVRKQTVAGGERYVTTELKQREAQLLHVQEQRTALEYQVLEQVRAAVAAQAEQLLHTADAVAQVDVYVSFAVVALEGQYVCPVLDEGDSVEIEAGRHPVVEVTQRDVSFVPNDTQLDAQQRLIVLTGPNMAGKSTYLRQVALIVLLAQVGSLVPARGAHVGLVDRIFTRVGAQDDLAAGQSTFMVEMAETSAILRACTPRSLLILDEIGRGTSTYDGLAIAQAVLEYLHDEPGHRAKTIFATHYHELTALAEQRAHVVNYRMAVLEEGDRVVFLRRVVRGGADKSYGIHVAELAGLPRQVVQRARTLLQQYEKTGQGSKQARRRVRETSEEMQLPLFTAGGDEDA